LVIAVFFGYLKIFNEGHFVFGDRDNHKMHFHPTQILYLTLFMAINLPLNIDDYVTTAKQIFQKLFYSRHFLAAYLCLLAISIILVDKFTLVHEFTLADNRHFIFYIYRFVHRFWIIKWMMCAVYAFCILFLFRIMVNSEEKLFKFLLWLVASVGYLAFGKLVEFRYFAISLLIYSFEIENRNINTDV
jgi:alpha-1,2-glucosyltransferase